MKFIFIFFMIASRAGAANLSNVKKLIDRNEYQGASALVSLQMALDATLRPSDRLRGLLLQAVLEASQKNFSTSKSLLGQARHYWQYQMQSDARFEAEIELCEFDVLAAEGL